MYFETIADCYGSGFHCGVNGQSSDCCPVPVQYEMQRRIWSDGWRAGQEVLAEALKNEVVIESGPKQTRFDFFGGYGHRW